MEIINKETTIKDVVTELPAFLCFGNVYYKIIDKRNLIIVDDYQFSKSIELGIMQHNNPFGNEGWKFIPENEFNKVLNKVFLELSAAVNQSKELILQ